MTKVGVAPQKEPPRHQFGISAMPCRTVALLQISPNDRAIAPETLEIIFEVTVIEVADDIDQELANVLWENIVNP